MNDSNLTNFQGSAASAAPKDRGFTPWQRLKTKRISYLALPLIVMATVAEFVILSIGWKYQRTVCLPHGMGVTFFGIGPIGATILMVELLKLPLAAWTASRYGWMKKFMLVMGLPLICVLTFQLVKDMAVYEMGVALTPASEMLEKASEQEVKIVQLNGELAAIQKKKADHDSKLAELAARKARTEADIEESLKRNDEARHDAISLTDYQKSELSDMAARQQTIIKQADADAAQLTKALADLRARREPELALASKWNAEQARLENKYKAKMADYANKKAAYDKARAEYDNANFLKRKLMSEPVDPGVPPEREENTILKPTQFAELDAQIKAKEAELAGVNKKRRDTVAQVEFDARQMRLNFDNRSSTKREEADRKREQLLASRAALSTQFAAEQKQLDGEYESAAGKADGVRAELDGCRKKAQQYYEARVASINNTQVFRIATTVEIIRGLVFGKHPVSITATAKERGDRYTDQISMVRIWVYPVLAFIIAFLPTLMVEVGFTTLFEPEKQRPQHRLGFLGRRMHWLYTRAGRLKILRAERMAREASAQIASRDAALATGKANAEQVLAEKQIELQSVLDAMSAGAARHEQDAKQKEEAWVAKLAAMADSLNRTVLEKDALRDFQKSEIERQVQLRQNAWSDRITQLRQELDEQRAAAETERTALIQEQHAKLMQVTEDCKAQVIEARRRMAKAELAATEKSSKLSQDLKEALSVRDVAQSELKHQADAYTVQLSQIQEEAAREMDKAVREEKYRSEKQQSEFEKMLRQREEDFARRLNQREQELLLAFDARVAEEKTRAEQDVRNREKELAAQFETRAREVDARWNQELQQREDAVQSRLKQREQQWQAQAELRLQDVQAQAEGQMRLRELEFERQLEAQSRDAESRRNKELQQQELAFHAKLKQREHELANRAAAREAEMQNQWASDLSTRQEDWQRQAESQVRAVEIRLAHEAQQKEESFEKKIRQREQQLQSQFDARQQELQSKFNEELRRRDAELAEASQREQDLTAKLVAHAETQLLAEKEWETKLERTRGTIAPLRTLVARTEKERDEAMQSASESSRQVQQLKRKSMEAFSLLNGWKDKEHPDGERD